MGLFNYKNNAMSGEAYILFKLGDMGQLQNVIDVGANRGSYIKEVLGVNQAAEVHAFEPNPKNAEYIKQSLGSNENVNVWQFAVGDTPGKMNLYDYPDEEGRGSSHASLHKEVISHIHESKSKGGFSSVEVDALTLDEWIHEQRPTWMEAKSVDFLKIDTEGNEFAVLQGAKEALANGVFRYIHFEFNEMNVVSRTFFKDFHDLLTRSSGYKLYRMLPKGLVLLDPYKAIQHELFGYQNILAVASDEKTP